MATDEARKLALFSINNEQVYRTSIQPIIKNLARKMAAGTYDPAMAPKAWSYAAEAGRRAYAKEWPGVRFSVRDRADAAQEIEAHYQDELQGTARDMALAKRWTVAAVRDAHTGHFFDRGTMAFFGDTLACFGTLARDGDVFLFRRRNGSKCPGRPVTGAWKFNPATGDISPTMDL